MLSETYRATFDERETSHAQVASSSAHRACLVQEDATCVSTEEAGELVLIPTIQSIQARIYTIDRFEAQML